MRKIILLLSVLLLPAAAGCSGPNVPPPREVVPVQGTLTHGGVPVAEAQLTFRGDDPSEPGFAVTDLSGRFRCMTNDSGDGMPAGEYVVTVSRAGGGIPEKYTDAELSPLQIIVEEGAENEFAIDLED